MTVSGPIPADDLGLTLTHEHAFADLRPYAEQVAKTLKSDLEDALEVILPYLRRLRELGCRSFVDATAAHLGRNPLLLRRLSEASGLHIVTVTGNYAAAGERFVPPYVRSDTVEELAARWTREWREGIDGSGVRPGMIKLGFDGGALTDIETKLIDAAARTHRASGLVIGAHVGPWGQAEPGANATSALAQIARLADAGVGASAWIWIHAQNVTDVTDLLQAAERGAWISFDGFRPDSVDEYADYVVRFRDAGLLQRVLLSQDAGWYSPGEPGGGDFEPFRPILTDLVPALLERGITQAEVDQLFVANPAGAFAIRVR